MIHIELTKGAQQALNHERYHHPHPHVQRKMEALLKSHAVSHQDICRLADISPHTLCDYLDDYASGGLEKLKVVNFYQPTSELTEHRETLETCFRQHPPATIPPRINQR